MMQLSDISILFVEDNETSRNTISQFLQEQFFKNIYIAKDGLEGLQMYKKHKPHIVLTDLTMPRMDGLAMSEQIKALDADVPILLITSQFEKDITEKAIDIGIDSYLFKPLIMGRLEKVLKNYCERLLIKKNFQIEHKILEEYKSTMFHQQEHLIKRIKEEVDKNTLFHIQREEENLLEAKFSTIGKIAAGITHEINTPLTYVRGNLELMAYDINHLDKSVVQKESLQKDVLTVLDGLNRIAGIVESMREMASQTNELPQTHNLYASLITALTLSQSKAKLISKIRIKDELFDLSIEKEKFNYPAKVQKQRIEQVFIIIINNALDVLALVSTFESRVLEIAIEREFEHVVVRFKDNGGGIDHAILPNIFEPFKSTKQEGGMGMGLNVAKRIVDDHHGKLVALNHAEGALFEVFLPINFTEQTQ